MSEDRADQEPTTMKFDKAALLGAGLLTYSVAATGEGEAGTLSRDQMLAGVLNNAPAPTTPS